MAGKNLAFLKIEWLHVGDGGKISPSVLRKGRLMSLQFRVFLENELKMIWGNRKMPAKVALGKS